MIKTKFSERAIAFDRTISCTLNNTICDNI